MILILQKLEKFVIEAKKNAVSIPFTGKETQILLNEDEIVLKYKRAFKALKKRTTDYATIPCVSCEKLCFKREITFFTISDNNGFDSQQIWSDLINYHKLSNGAKLDVCIFC